MHQCTQQQCWVLINNRASESDSQQTFSIPINPGDGYKLKVKLGPFFAVALLSFINSIVKLRIILLHPPVYVCCRCYFGNKKKEVCVIHESNFSVVGRDLCGFNFASVFYVGMNHIQRVGGSVAEPLILAPSPSFDISLAKHGGFGGRQKAKGKKGRRKKRIWPPLGDTRFHGDVEHVLMCMMYISSSPASCAARTQTVCLPPHCTWGKSRQDPK